MSSSRLSYPSDKVAFLFFLVSHVSCLSLVILTCGLWKQYNWLGRIVSKFLINQFFVSIYYLSYYVIHRFFNF
jgi:hypothetical protein